MKKRPWFIIIYCGTILRCVPIYVRSYISGQKFVSPHLHHHHHFGSLPCSTSYKMASYVVATMHGEPELYCAREMDPVAMYEDLANWTFWLLLVKPFASVCWWCLHLRLGTHTWRVLCSNCLWNKWIAITSWSLNVNVSHCTGFLLSLRICYSVKHLSHLHKNGSIEMSDKVFTLRTIDLL